MHLSPTEENYIKAIFTLAENQSGFVSTNAIAAAMNTAPASVTDMIKKLSEKKLLLYVKYKGVQLEKEGDIIARKLIRRHRLWEYFLVEKLNFNWNEIQHMAEQLEHVQSDELTNRLDEFLDFPKYDPHGDPIPDKDGNYNYVSENFLSDIKRGFKAIIVGVKDHDPALLAYLDQLNIALGTEVIVREIYDFDNSMRIVVSNEEVTISHQVAKNLYVKN